MTTLNISLNASDCCSGQMASVRIRWPVLLMGSHSVMPSTMPSKMTFSHSIKFMKNLLSGYLFDSMPTPGKYSTSSAGCQSKRGCREAHLLPERTSLHSLYSLLLFPQCTRQWAQSPLQPPQPQPRWCSMCQSDTASHAASSASTAHSSHPMRQVISSRS